MQRLGLGYAELRAANPRLVYCSITGYGQTGPYAQKGAFDVTVQALSGLMSVTGEEDGQPVKCGVPVGDFAAGLYAAYTILAAVMRARQSGVGAAIDCSMLGSLLGIAALQTSQYFGTGRSPRKLGSAHPRNAPYQAFQASDAPFVVAAGNDKLWRDLCGLVSRPELPGDPRFTTQSLRAENQKQLATILQPIFATRTAGEWLAALDDTGIPCAPINTFEEVLADRQVAHMGWVQPARLPNAVSLPTVGFPIGMTDFEFELTRPPPELGQHNDEVFEEWLTK